ncbi:MAG: polysaccharide biosynthesis tyrosine autokinase [Oscillospiraceae bacterium]|nr:polysaccharide biosynthesis tyrosine autokinase [Oscillospiraceae bacterium]
MNTKNEVRASDIEPRCVLKLILQNIYLVVLAILIASMAAVQVMEITYKPQYSSSTTFVVQGKSGTASSNSNLSTANEVAVLFSDLLKSNLMRNIICRELGVSYMPGTITASVAGETNILEVTSTASSPQTAYKMAKIVEEQYSELSEYITNSAVLQAINSAQVSIEPSNYMNRSYVIALSAIGGGFAMLALLVIVCIRRDTIQTREGAKHKLDGHILVTVPHEKFKKGISTKGSNLLISSALVSFFFRETFSRLQLSIEMESKKKSQKPGATVILVTSTTANEGKSTVSANLALAMAQKHNSVMLIDADLRNPTQMRLFGRSAARGNGLTGVLQAEYLDASTVISAAHYDEEKNLITLFNAQPTDNAADLLSSDNMEKLLDIARRSMDFIVIDSPPLGMFADSDSLAGLVDESILVVRQDVAAAADINDTVDLLKQSKTTFLGFVLNDFRSLSIRRPRRSYGYHYGYGYGYGYGYNYYGESGKHHGHRSRTVHDKSDGRR